MITVGYPGLDVDSELDLAQRLGASVLEILPQWRDLPDPAPVRSAAADRGLSIHSAHGCWGSQAIKAYRVDLGSTDRTIHRESVDDLKRCVDWLTAAGGTCLVVHPGGLSFPADHAVRRDSLARGLGELADHATGSHVLICVENMPPGVFPGSRMADLLDLLRKLAMPGLALALDTGHAHISAELGAETLAAGSLLATTHVHDNDGRSDSHEPPGRGTIDWTAWAIALDQIDYRGPIMLECVRRLRADPASFCPEVLAPLLKRQN
jgi:sugar phosphate isomerase/epimerase